MSLPPKIQQLEIPHEKWKYFSGVSTPIDLTLIVHCQRCGKGIILSSGLHQPSEEKQREILIQKGWQIMPKKFCRTCACPMEVWEIQRWEKFEGQFKTHFEGQMRDKYGSKVDKYFNSKP